MNRPICFAVIGVIVLSAVPTARGDDAAGRRVFIKWCAPCHARGPGNPGTTTLAAVYKNSIPAALEDRTDLTEPFIRESVRTGFFVMPFFRKTEISDADLDALVAYLARSAPPKR